MSKKYSQKVDRNAEYTRHKCCACSGEIRVGELSWCSSPSHMSGPIGPQPVCARCKATPPKFLKGIYYWEDRDFS